MTYALKPGDKSLQAAVRRIARDEIDDALAEIRKQKSDTLGETIHEVRKAAKKVRGLLRLVRPGLPAYSHENRTLRDAARRLSSLRDRGTLIEAYDRLVSHYSSENREEHLSPLRTALVSDHGVVEEDPATLGELEAYAKTLREVRSRTSKWKLTERDADALAGGIAMTYDRAQAATRAARHKLTDAGLHEWRKRAKYHRYHCRIMAPVWPEMLIPRATEAQRLEDLLGEHRDLTLLTAASERLGQPDDPSTRAILTGLAEQRQAEILAEAGPLAARLFTEPSEALTGRWIGWYKVWRKS